MELIPDLSPRAWARITATASHPAPSWCRLASFLNLLSCFPFKNVLIVKHSKVNIPFHDFRPLEAMPKPHCSACALQLPPFLSKTASWFRSFLFFSNPYIFFLSPYASLLDCSISLGHWAISVVNYSAVPQGGVQAFQPCILASTELNGSGCSYISCFYPSIRTSTRCPDGLGWSPRSVFATVLPCAASQDRCALLCAANPGPPCSSGVPGVCAY